MYDDMCGSFLFYFCFLPNNFIHAGHERRAKNNAISKLTCNSIDFGLSKFTLGFYCVVMDKYPKSRGKKNGLEHLINFMKTTFLCFF